MKTLTEKSLSIRPLAIWEIALCLPHAEAFHREMQLPGQLIPEVFERNWIKLLGTMKAAILSVWKDDVLIGALGALVSPDILDDRLVATEMFWYILPAHRGGSAAMRLLRAYKAWAIEKECVEYRLVHLLTKGETWQEMKMGRLYRKLGYTAIEVAWMCPLKE